MKELIDYNKFIHNKYYKIYYNIIINRCKQDLPKIGNANHHILPKSLGGSNNKDNRINVTHKEHFILHHLLIKFSSCDDLIKMSRAYNCFFKKNMNNGNIKYSARTYNYQKNKFSKLLSIKMTKEPIQYDKKIYIFKNIVTGEILKTTRIGFRKIYPEFTGQNLAHLISKKHGVYKNWAIFVEEINKFSSEIKPKTRIIKHNSEKKICPHCKKEVSFMNFSKWHGDNCKLINKKQHEKNIKHIQQVAKEQNKKRIICEYCSKITNVLNYNKWHGDNCKFKVNL